MIAMELHGAHVGSKVTLTWTKRKAAQEATPKKPVVIKVSKVTHWRNGDVSLGEGAGYYNPPRRYPPDAQVIKIEMPTTEVIVPS